MALEKCKECGEEVSVKAKTCPHCGVSSPGVTKAQGCLGFIAICAVVAIAMLLFGSPEAVNKANDRLTLMYIDKEIYSPVTCESEKVDGDYYIRCAPADSSVIGGLYMVEIHDDDRYQIYTVNGKAGTHAGDKFPEVAENKDIPGILDKF